MQQNLNIQTGFHIANIIRKSGYGDISYISNNNPLLSNHLLTAPRQSFSKPLTFYVNELKSLMKNLFTVPGAGTSPEQLADIYNKAVMIFIACGNHRFAREICYSMIQIFLGWSAKTENYHLLKHVFQPWISLIRIDRLEGNYHAAHNKINALNMIDCSTPMADDSKLLTRALRHLIKQDAEAGQMINTNVTIERIKAYLNACHYPEIIHNLPSRAMPGLRACHFVQVEALVIALANTGRVSDALIMLDSVRYCSDQTIMRIFQIRKFELMAAIAGKDISIKDINNFSRMALNMFNSNNVTANDITFALHTAFVINFAGYKDFATKLAYECVAAAERNHDQLLKAESLVLLYDMIIAADGRAIIEDIMIDLYFQTRYAGVRRLLLNCFADLGCVETAQDDDEINALYEYLLVMANNLTII